MVQVLDCNKHKSKQQPPQQQPLQQPQQPPVLNRTGTEPFAHFQDAAPQVTRQTGLSHAGGTASFME